jgi:hypothetical protein
VKKAGYSLISIDNNDVAPKVIKMITANFIDVNKLYNFCTSDGLDFCLFVIKFDAEISTQSSLLKIKRKRVKRRIYTLIIV